MKRGWRKSQEGRRRDSPALGRFEEVSAEGFRSPEGDPRFGPEAGVKPLNNLVFELLKVESPSVLGHPFRNPREGWPAKS